MIKLELDSVTKIYNKRAVIDKLSLQVRDNEFFVILGPSGEGKSTLLRLIAGIEKPDSGKIYIDSKDVTDLPPNKRNIAMVFQSYALYPNKNVFENIAFPLKMSKLSKQEISKRVTEIAERLGIKDILEKPVTKISGGQQQRVALARALVRDPSLFLMDEPLSNIDPRTRFSAIKLLKSIQKEYKKTFILVTHNHAEAATLADRIGVLHKGKFEQIGSYTELYERPATRWIGEFIGDVPMNFIDAKVFNIDFNGEIGFRPEWVSLEDKVFECEVESTEVIGDSYYVSCRIGENQIVVRAERQYEIGEKLGFSIKKYYKYIEGKLAE
ncbi:ABC transporter ATP-binding protein [Stygiolobus caldivivus]|uniref:Sugar ABC transporter ATP-binding protein n=1 Tax=Stygiolobus caldivivus TaxID=2824673 RepID=A0A8D5U8U7_9CREN|nr:ABC transporter ATP-binding protein [Stygiolobus caldivivus]BCU71539.1 sugar ABC transporter ATP-binding protein [Stygiolobus caldivivus]